MIKEAFSLAAEPAPREHADFLLCGTARSLRMSD